MKSYKPMMVFAPDGAGGGGDSGPQLPPFEQLVPAEYKSEGSLQAIKTLPDLFKSYVNAQKLIGSDKVVLPQKDWDETKYNEFYSKLGRPADPKEYKMPEVKLHESLKLDDEKLSETWKHFHKLGLSASQASGVMEHYLNAMNQGATEAESISKESVTKATEALKGEWGEKYDENLGIAKLALTKFGSPEFIGFIESTGLGNNPELIRIFHKIGIAMGEDVGNRGKGVGAGGMTPEDAIREITAMKTNEEFLKLMAGKELDPARKKELLQKWTDLHKVAYPA